MEKLLITANFHVFVATGQTPDGENTPDRKVAFSKGMLVHVADIPEAQSADDWIAKGLATAA